MKNILLCFSIIILIFQSGCTQPNIVDTQRIIHVGGFDITKDKKFRGTILISRLYKGRTIKTRNSVNYCKYN